MEVLGGKILKNTAGFKGPPGTWFEYLAFYRCPPKIVTATSM